MWQQQAARQSRAFLKHVVPAVLKPARALWNQLIGFLFMCMGAVSALRTARYAYQHDTFRTVFMAAGTAIMLWYGISSFLKARKISRS